MGGLREYVVVLVATVPAAAAPVPIPCGDDAVSGAAIRMLQHDPVQRELNLSARVVEKLSRAADPSGLLRPGQRSRLRQLERQVLGPAAFAEPAVRKSLDLSRSQQELVADLVKELDHRIAEYLAIFGNDDADNLKTGLLALRKKSLRRIDESLSSDQRRLWKDLVGAPATAFDPSLYWLYVIVEERLRAP